MSANPHTPNETDLDQATQRTEDAAEELVEAEAAADEAVVDFEQAAPGQAPEAPAGSREAELEEELAQVQERLDKALYAVSDAQNAQRRAQQEGEKQAKFAAEKFAKDVLAVADNLRRALDNTPEGAGEESDITAKLVEGVQMTERELLNTLNRHGVERIESVGQPFDPNVHQAVQEMEDPSVPHHTVLQELQTGYTMHGRLLREAMVIVSKGGPKTADTAVDTSA